MMDVIVEVCRALALTLSEKKTRDHVHASTMYTADDDASPTGRASLQTGSILHLPGVRRYRNPGHVH